MERKLTETVYFFKRILILTVDAVCFSATFTRAIRLDGGKPG
jgi:hypothetical protein